jgi:hypothetical protein
VDGSDFSLDHLDVYRAVSRNGQASSVPNVFSSLGNFRVMKREMSNHGRKASV